MCDGDGDSDGDDDSDSDSDGDSDGGQMVMVVVLGNAGMWRQPSLGASLPGLVKTFVMKDKVRSLLYYPNDNQLAVLDTPKAVNY